MSSHLLQTSPSSSSPDLLLNSLQKSVQVAHPLGSHSWFPSLSTFYKTKLSIHILPIILVLTSVTAQMVLCYYCSKDNVLTKMWYVLTKIQFLFLPGTHNQTIFLSLPQAGPMVLPNRLGIDWVGPQIGSSKGSAHRRNVHFFQAQSSTHFLFPHLPVRCKDLGPQLTVRLSSFTNPYSL